MYQTSEVKNFQRINDKIINDANNEQFNWRKKNYSNNLFTQIIISLKQKINKSL